MIGALCGSSYINERFQELLFGKLKDEHYLEENGEPLSKIINELVVEFERRDKKKMDMMFPDQIRDTIFRVPGLKEDQKRHFLKGRMTIKR